MKPPLLKIITSSLLLASFVIFVVSALSLIVQGIQYAMKKKVISPSNWQLFPSSHRLLALAVAHLLSLSLAGCNDDFNINRVETLEKQLAQSVELLNSATSQLESLNAQSDSLTLERDAIKVKYEQLAADKLADQASQEALLQELRTLLASTQAQLQLLEQEKNTEQEIYPYTGTWVSENKLLRLVVFDDGFWMMQKNTGVLGPFEKWEGTNPVPNIKQPMVLQEFNPIQKANDTNACILPYTLKGGESKSLRFYAQTAATGRLVSDAEEGFDLNMVRVTEDWHPRDPLPEDPLKEMAAREYMQQLKSRQLEYLQGRRSR